MNYVILFYIHYLFENFLVFLIIQINKDNFSHKPKYFDKRNYKYNYRKRKAL